ncbi:MAG: zinc ribbon domain-containing protein, partial [Clostridia bacterium]|nr:zinc ribbon domain-containing protein [Clostridia bacterium]
FCTCCGTPYYRRESKDKQGNKNSKWVCSGKINNGADSCASFAIYEEEIKPLLFEVFKDTRDLSAAMMEEYERIYRSMTSDGTLGKRIQEQEEAADLARRKKSKLLDLLMAEKITDDDFAEMTKTCTLEIKEAEQALAELQAQEESSADFYAHMEKIHHTLKEASMYCHGSAITKEFVDSFIDKIYVTPQGSGVVQLDIKIFTGDSCEKYLEKLKNHAKSEIVTETEVRTGHTFKKMIESYENNLSAK